MPDAYMQALELDRRNVDAWVARGAAYANQHAFPKAISHFQTALGVLRSHLQHALPKLSDNAWVTPSSHVIICQIWHRVYYY